MAQFCIRVILSRTSNERFPYSAANTLHDFELVGVDHFDLSLIANKCCYADVCQWRAQLYVVWPKLSCGAPFFKCVTGIQEPCDRRPHIESGALAKLPKHKASVVKVTRFGPGHITMRSVE